ncbi:hypothetical protein MRX96_011296 [Rhipicephalus microplus]
METSKKAKVQSSRRPGLVPGLLRLPRSNASNVLLFQLGVGDQWWTAERTPKRLLPPQVPSSFFSKSWQQLFEKLLPVLRSPAGRGYGGRGASTGCFAHRY